MLKMKSEHTKDAYTSYIGYDRWWHLFHRWRYAEYINRPLNIQGKFCFPSGMDGESQIKFQEALVCRIREDLTKYGVEPFYMLHRHSDPVTELAMIDLLIHSPDNLIDRLREDLLNWEYMNATHVVDHLIDFGPDNKMRGTFLKVFGAFPPEFAEENPSFPYQPSGLILGPRTEYSENLLEKNKSRKRRR